MQKCPNCGQQNRPGVIFCENCGASLIGKLPLSTRTLDSTDTEQAAIGVDASIVTDVTVQGSATFEQGMVLRLEIEGSPDPIRFAPKPETIFGRRDPATGDKPDIDLTPFAGYRMGVSRRHAAIRPGDENGLDLWDLGSSNGTFLNGQRLSAHRPYRLRDGDEIRLGQMVIRIHFEREAAPLAGLREASRTPVPAPGVGEPEPPPAEAAAPASGAAQPSTEPAQAEAPQPAPAAERPTDPIPPRPRPAPQEAADAQAPEAPAAKPPEAKAPKAPAVEPPAAEAPAEAAPAEARPEPGAPASEASSAAAQAGQPNGEPGKEAAPKPAAEPSAQASEKPAAPAEDKPAEKPDEPPPPDDKTSG